MFNLYVVFVKYLLVIDIIFYTFLSFDVFVVKKERIPKDQLAKMSEKSIKKKNDLYHKRYLAKKGTMFSVQYVLVLFTHVLCYSVLYLEDFDTGILVLGIFQLAFLIGFKKIFSIVYKGFSRLLFNNMLMLIDIGFIMLARLAITSGVKQFIIIIISSGLCLIIPRVIEKFESIDKYDWIYALAGLGLLLAVLLLGTKKFGATNWLKIGNTSLQPSEIVKIIFIFCMASMLCKYKDNFKKICLITGFAAVHVIILALGKDLGAALLFFVTFVIMLFIATKKKRYLGAGAGFGIISAVGAYNIPNYKHVRVRINAWRDPWSYINSDGYQVAQSLFAIGTGSWFGMGLTKGMPENIPVRTSDFIFGAICEEMGVIVGAMIVLICLSCFIMFVNIAMLIQKLFYKLIAIGLSTMYIFQVLLNVGGVTKFIPSTGVTLPLISYGGSSIISTLIVFSVIQGMYVRKSDSYLQRID